MILRPPFQISARLAPAVKIGSAWLSLIRTEPGDERRLRCTFALDVPDWECPAAFEYVDTNMQTGVDGDTVQNMFANFLGFLSAAVESYQYRCRTGRQSENEDLFPFQVVEWAATHADEISSLCCEIEETPNLIEENQP